MIKLEFNAEEFVKGLGVIANKIEASETAVKLDALAYLKKVADKVHVEAKKIVPFDTGILHDTSMVYKDFDSWIVKFSALNIKGYFNYAWIQHENLEFKHAPGRTAKYLEKPFNEYTSGVNAELRNILMRHLTGGING